MFDPDYALFARVVEAGSLSAAARALSASPAMVSKRLARLEARLGVRLLHRTTRRLALTAAGEAFHRDVAAILHAIAEAEARITGAQDEPAGLLRVSAPTSFGRVHVAPRLDAFLRAHPRVALQFDLSDAYVDLLDGRVDVAIRIAAGIPSSLSAYRLGTNRRLLCASPAYLGAAGVPASIEALRHHRLLAADGQLPWRLVSGRRRASVGAESHVRTNSSEIVRELALAGVGVALRSRWDVADLLAEGRLVPVLPEWEAPGDLAIWAVHPRMPTPPAAVTAFVRFLAAAVDADAWEGAAARATPDSPLA